MPVRQENAHAVHFNLKIRRDLCGIVAVARHIEYIKTAEREVQILRVAEMVAEMDDTVGRFALHRFIHIPKRAVRVGKNKNFHTMHQRRRVGIDWM